MAKSNPEITYYDNGQKAGETWYLNGTRYDDSHTLNDGRVVSVEKTSN